MRRYRETRNGAGDDEAYYSERLGSDQIADERARCIPGAVDYRYISRFGRIEYLVDEEIVTRAPARRWNARQPNCTPAQTGRSPATIPNLC